MKTSALAELLVHNATQQPVKTRSFPSPIYEKFSLPYFEYYS